MGRAQPDLSMTPERVMLDLAWRRSHAHDEERLPLGTCALVIGGLSVGLWALAWVTLRMLG